MNQQQINAMRTAFYSDAAAFAAVSYLSADELVYQPDLAEDYVAGRWNDAATVLADLKWSPELGGRCLFAPLFHSGLIVRHEIVPATLHAGACWGEILDTRDSSADPVICATYACFMAFVLKKFG